MYNSSAAQAVQKDISAGHIRMKMRHQKIQIMSEAVEMCHVFGDSIKSTALATGSTVSQIN